MIRCVEETAVGASPSLGRVLFLSASVGGGHTRAAEAIAAGIRARAGRGALRYERADVVDTLAHATPWFRGAYRGMYLGLLERAPRVLGWLYRRSDRAYRGVRTRWATAHANLRGLREAIAAFAPDTIVSTHFLPSEYLAGLRRRGQLDARLVTVVTDVHVHGMWLADPCDRYLVAATSSKATLEANGVDARRIDVTGIPIDPAFAEPLSRDEARRRHDLPLDRPVILFSTGGACVGPIDALFADLLRLRTRCTIVAVCGRSELARATLERRLGRHPQGHAVDARVLGYTTSMHELMAAADLLVGKPGGLTSTECRARGLPMAIVHAVPGQEEHNAAELLAIGCAWRCPRGDALAPALDELLASPETLERMRGAARASATPRSGLLAADRLAEHFDRRRNGVIRG
ncbi:MAG: UDP-N-acetylglucosamine--LPS N-acetylglucosamine transferase [Phycisphaerae bacterium]|nr:UDP-N-acetylglucosamine--LPS N-acetylglucosamine transferase [Phycisphaerae bacterium]